MLPELYLVLRIWNDPTDTYFHVIGTYTSRDYAEEVISELETVENTTLFLIPHDRNKTYSNVDKSIQTIN